MKNLKTFIMTIGIINIMAGIILVAFVIMMQNLLAFFLGILYVIFGISLITGKVLGKLLYWGIIPLSVLHSNVIIMLGINKNVPIYYQVPLYAGIIIFIIPLLLVILCNLYILKSKKQRK